jgi:integrase
LRKKEDKGAMALTVKKVAALRRRPGRYGDGHGLVLQVISPTNASWLFCYERQGRAHQMGLGPLHTIGLKEARERARAARQLLLDGIDPLEQKRAERDRRAAEAARSVTFKTCAERYYTAHADEWTNVKHRRQFLATMQSYVYPVMGALSVAAIDEAMVLKVLTPIWKEKTVTARRIRTRVAAVLDYAAAAKYRTGPNPARWEGNLEFLLPKPERIAAMRHHRALPHTQISTFMAALRACPPSAATLALEFTVLTACRTNEVRGARWSEMDLQNRIWTIPAKRMKAGKEHRVPLSDRAIELLSALPREVDNPHVFIGQRSAISTNAIYHALRQMRDDIDVHGFRSTFSTWAHETTAYPAHVIEQSLAHTVGSAVERAYRRGDLFDKRRQLMEAWARYCSTAPQVGEVVPIRGQS